MGAGKSEVVLVMTGKVVYLQMVVRLERLGWGCGGEVPRRALALELIARRWSWVSIHDERQRGSQAPNAGCTQLRA